MRFHLVDRIEEICYGKYIVGVKCITLADDVFNEHFPSYPIFPGSLILEGMAQLSGSFFQLMMAREGDSSRQAILTMANRLKFKRPAEPGDRMVFRADIVSMREDFGVAKVTAEIDGEPTASGELTFSFVPIEDEALLESRKDLYRICMKKTRVIE